MNKEEEKLEKLNKEIKQAQDKLGGIDSAINREKLALEELGKDKVFLTKEVEQLKKDTVLATEEYVTEDEKLTSFKAKSRATLIELNDEINKTKVELSNVISTKNNEISTLNTEIQTAEEKLSARKKDIIIQTKEHDAILDSKKKELADLNLKESILRSNKIELESQIKAITSQLKSLEDAVTNKEIDLSSLEKEYVSVQKAIKSSNDEVLEIESELSKLKTQKEEAKDQIKALKEEAEKLALENDAINEEKAEISRQKFQIRETTNALNKREDFIKEKFQEAGVIYQ